MQVKNEDVRLSYLKIADDLSKPKKPMLVLHGLLGSKVNWKGICGHKHIQKKRDCFLIEMRNHATSDHHPTHNYEVMSDDIIRFADSMKIEKFTVLGHSMGARTAMTIATRYPDRIDGAVSVDAAPVNESGNDAFGSFAQKVVRFNSNL